MTILKWTIWLLKTSTLCAFSCMYSKMISLHMIYTQDKPFIFLESDIYIFFLDDFTDELRSFGYTKYIFTEMDTHLAIFQANTCSSFHTLVRNSCIHQQYSSFHHHNKLVLHMHKSSHLWMKRDEGSYRIIKGRPGIINERNFYSSLQWSGSVYKMYIHVHYKCILLQRCLQPCL